MTLFFIVGLVFILFGSWLIYLANFYKLNGKKFEGSVYAVERYEYEDNHHGTLRTYTMYRPVYKYKFKEEEVYFSEGSSNIVGTKIGEKVIVYALDKGPEYCSVLDDSKLKAGFAFCIFGLIAILVFFFQGKFEMSSLEKAFYLFSAIAIVSIFKKIQKIAGNKDELFFKTSNVRKKEELIGENFILKQEEIDQLILKNNSNQLIVSLVFFILMFVSTVLLWETGMNENLKSDYVEVVKIFNIEAIKNFLVENPISIAFTILMSFAILSFVSLVSTYLKKFNK